MNWGTKLTIGMITFMLFIISLVVIMFMRHEKDSLIENDYYEKGQTYDNDYQAKENALEDNVRPIVSVSKDGLWIRFPVAVTYEILCRRASDQLMDRTFKSKLATGYVLIPAEKLHPGPWLVRINYQIPNKKYLLESKVTLP